jgi:hypothetical protein
MIAASLRRFWDDTFLAIFALFLADKSVTNPRLTKLLGRPARIRKWQEDLAVIRKQNQTESAEDLM